MAFTTQYDPEEILVMGDNTLVMGTASLGDTFGEIVTFTVTRKADIENIEAANGNLRAVVMKNLQFEAKIETILDSSVTAPGIGEIYSIPFAGVEGRITEVSVDLAKGTERTMTFTVMHWDALADAVMYKLDTSTGTFVSIDA